MSDFVTVTLPVSRQCEHKDCSKNPTTAYVVTGDAGKDGVAVYCEKHCDTWADPRDTHTALTTVDQP